MANLEKTPAKVMVDHRSTAKFHTTNTVNTMWLVKLRMESDALIQFQASMLMLRNSAIGSTQSLTNENLNKSTILPSRKILSPIEFHVRLVDDKPLLKIIKIFNKFFEKFCK